VDGSGVVEGFGSVPPYKAGVAAAILKRGDKYEVSAALGKAYGLPVVTTD
jgi:hypothetical protein